MTDPVGGMIEDIPKLVASQQEAKEKLRLAKEERSRKKQEQTSSQLSETASQPSQTRYELRKRLNSTKTYTVWHILKPP